MTGWMRSSPSTRRRPCRYSCKEKQSSLHLLCKSLHSPVVPRRAISSCPHHPVRLFVHRAISVPIKVVQCPSTRPQHATPRHAAPRPAAGHETTRADAHPRQRENHGHGKGPRGHFKNMYYLSSPRAGMRMRMRRRMHMRMLKPRPCDRAQIKRCIKMYSY